MPDWVTVPRAFRYSFCSDVFRSTGMVIRNAQLSDVNFKYEGYQHRPVGEVRIMQGAIRFVQSGDACR